MAVNIHHFLSSSRNLSAGMEINSPFSYLLYASSVLLANSKSSARLPSISEAFFIIIWSLFFIRTSLSPSFMLLLISNGITIWPFELILVMLMSIINHQVRLILLVYKGCGFNRKKLVSNGFGLNEGI